MKHKADSEEWTRLRDLIEVFESWTRADAASGSNNDEYVHRLLEARAELFAQITKLEQQLADVTAAHYRLWRQHSPKWY